MKLATIGPAVRTKKPKNQGVRKAYAAQVSRSLNPDAQRRALVPGPGAAALETVAKPVRPNRAVPISARS
jgi:hypothetical protein